MRHIKRVGYLLRVSTLKQTNDKEDIPMQREACLSFIEKKGWEVYKEYLESGVSGYHKSYKDREKLQEIMQDALDRKFDILLVFMFDRLGRKYDETFRFLEIMSLLNVEIWSVKEGQQEFRNATDPLMNYIRFWNANLESKKTAERVDGGRTYATREGRFTGGVVPYGYTLVPTGKLDRKGRMINDFVKEPTESSVVADIFRQLIENNLSLNGIVQYLNIDLGLKTRKGCSWNPSTVRNILKNPIYKGYMSYGKTRGQEILAKEIDIENLQVEKVKRHRAVSPEQWILAREQNADYVIVSEEKWQMAQDILARRYKKYTDSLRTLADRTWKSPLLLAGLLECGYCHGMISPATASQKSVSKTGEVKRYYTEFYKCNTRGRGKELCASKSYIGRKNLENVVLNEVYNLLDRIESIDCSKEIQKNMMYSFAYEKERLKTLENELTNNKKAVDKMKEDIYRSYIGETELDTKYINMAMQEVEAKKAALLEETESVKRTIELKELAITEYQRQNRMIPVWREVFDVVPLNIKKHLLNTLIEKIVVKDSEINIFFKMDIDSFLGVRSHGAP